MMVMGKPGQAKDGEKKLGSRTLKSRIRRRRAAVDMAMFRVGRTGEGGGAWVKAMDINSILWIYRRKVLFRKAEKGDEIDGRRIGKEGKL